MISDISYVIGKNIFYFSPYTSNPGFQRKSKPLLTKRKVIWECDMKAKKIYKV